MRRDGTVNLRVKVAVIKIKDVRLFFSFSIDYLTSELPAVFSVDLHSACFKTSIMVSNLCRLASAFVPLPKAVYPERKGGAGWIGAAVVSHPLEEWIYLD